MGTQMRLLPGRRCGLTTDYSAAGFARRYSRSRPLGKRQRDTWIQVLGHNVPASTVNLVVDLGAGVGRFWPVIAGAWHPTVIVAVDRSVEMLLAGETQLPVIRVVADIDAVPIGPGTMDACFCSMVMHHSPDPEATLGRLRMLMRPGGYLCIRTGTTSTVKSFEFLRFFPTAMRAELLAMPLDEGLTAWILSAGFESLRKETIIVPVDVSRWGRLRAVAQRGFPSLQLVPKCELVVGTLRFACDLVRQWLTSELPASESAVLVTARRSLDG